MNLYIDKSIDYDLKGYFFQLPWILMDTDIYVIDTYVTSNIYIAYGEVDMARPIELGLVLEGKDAEEFWENEKNPKVTDEQKEMFKEAMRIYKANPF